MSDSARPLIEAARRDHLHHSLILHGPVGRELRETATRIAQALNCDNGEGNDGCLSCRKIDQQLHPDVQVIEVRSDRKMISIEQIRELVAAASFKPFEGGNKVFIIDPVDAISNHGANSLLKTLEEPTSSTYFLLLTRSPDRLLQTIRSRSQIFSVRPRARFLPIEKANEEGISLQEARLAAASVSDGSFDEQRELLLDVTELLYQWSSRRDTTALLSLGTLLGAHDDPAASAELYLAVMRDLLGTHPDDSIDPGKFENIQSRINPAQIHDSAREMMRCIDMMSVNIDPRNAFEGAVLALVPPR